MTDNKSFHQPHTDASIVCLDWPAPKSVKACYTKRSGGYSTEPYGSFNLGDHVADSAVNVANNRKQLQKLIGQQAICWLQQVHGTNIVDLRPSAAASGIKADACYTQQLNQVCSVMTADCLPVFFCDALGSQVAVAHAGWRGLHAGVLQQTLKKFQQAAQARSQLKPSNTIIAYLGPAISQAAFEVGDDVRDAFLSLPHDQLRQGRQYFKAGQSLDISHSDINKQHHKWMADLYGLAKDMLNNMGVSEVYGGDRCTFCEGDDFFSYRRDGVTGRMANLIWLDESCGKN